MVRLFGLFFVFAVFLLLILLLFTLITLSIFTLLLHSFSLCLIFSGEGGWLVIFRIFKCILFFVNWNFIVLFPFLIKYYHIFFIIIVFRLGSDKLVSCFFYCFSQGISHGMWLFAWGGWMIFNFRLFKSILFFVNWNSSYFSHLLVVLTCYVYYYCIW